MRLVARFPCNLAGFSRCSTLPSKDPEHPRKAPDLSRRPSPSVPGACSRQRQQVSGAQKSARTSATRCGLWRIADVSCECSGRERIPGNGVDLGSSPACCGPRRLTMASAWTASTSASRTYPSGCEMLLRAAKGDRRSSPRPPQSPHEPDMVDQVVCDVVDRNDADVVG
jgi:hypothetical protein